MASKIQMKGDVMTYCYERGDETKRGLGNKTVFVSLKWGGKFGGKNDEAKNDNVNDNDK